MEHALGKADRHTVHSIVFSLGAIASFVVLMLLAVKPLGAALIVGASGVFWIASILFSLEQRKAEAMFGISQPHTDGRALSMIIVALGISIIAGAVFEGWTIAALSACVVVLSYLAERKRHSAVQRYTELYLRKR